MFGRPLFLCDFETTGIHEEAEPIEIGYMILSEDLSILRAREFLIRPDSLKKFDGKPVKWSRDQLPGYECHKIEADLVFKRGVTMTEAGAKILSDIVDSLDLPGNTMTEEIKLSGVAVASDCLPMEWSMLEKLFGHYRGDRWPFHYDGISVDTIADPLGVFIPQKKHHRALADVGLMYSRLIVARDRIKMAFESNRPKWMRGF